MSESTSGPRQPLPLEGLRVVEAGIVVAGPFCGSLLADLGAQVVKIERPGEGDPARQMGPRKNEVPLWWGVASRDKRCVALDLTDPVDRERFLSLVADADVLVENFRPGAMQRLGLGTNALTKVNPRLIVISISGFGLSTKNAGRPGFGKIAEGLSGIVPLTGAPDDIPVHVGFSLADTSSGLMGCLAAIMALYDRDRNGGRGSQADIALYEPLLRMTELQMALRETSGAAPVRRGSNDPYGWGAADEIQRHYLSARCADGAEILVKIDDMSASKLSMLAGTSANADSQSLDVAVRSWLATLSIAEAGERLRSLGVEAARIHDGLSIAGDPYFRVRRDVLSVSDPRAGSFFVTGHIPRRAVSALTPFRAADVGEDNAEVFKSV